MCAIALWLRAFFIFRTLPETMIAIEASEVKFLFSYLFCSLCSILLLENSTVPQCMTTLAKTYGGNLDLFCALLDTLVFAAKIWLFLAELVPGFLP